MRLAAAITLLALLQPGLAKAANDPFNFSYSGRLTEPNGAPVSGPVALSISFYNVATGGTPLLTVTSGLTSVPLQEGIFQVSLTLSGSDFNTAFPSVKDPVYIEITDLTNKPDAPYDRQLVAMVPFAAKVPVDGVTLEFNSQGELALANTATAGTATIATINAATSGTLAPALLPAAGGDLSGTLDAATVSRFQGRPISAVQPNLDEFLKWNGTSWAPTALAGAAGGTVTTVTTGPGLAGGPITASGTVDLRLNAAGGLSKTLGAGSNELGVAAGGVSLSMLSNSGANCGTTGNVFKVASGAWTCGSIDLGGAETTGILTPAEGGTGANNSSVAANRVFASPNGSAGPPTFRALVAGDITGLLLADADNDTKVQVEESADEDKIRFDTAGSERMIIDATGNVGIGTTTPTNPLEVQRTSLSAGAIASIHGAGTTVHTTDQGDAGLNVTYTMSASSATNELINRGIEVGYTNNLTGGGHVQNARILNIYAGTNAGTITDNMASILLENNATAGTVTNGYGLKIDGVQGTNAWGVYDQSGKNWYASGNVGVGTTSPGQLLHVRSTTDQTNAVRIEGTSNGTLAYTEYQMKSDARQYNFGVAGSGTNVGVENKFYIYDATASAFRMVVGTAGNVGIGTVSPGSRLEVNGGGNTVGSTVLSGSSSKWASLGVGRTAVDLSMAAASSATEWSDITTAGDVVLRANSEDLILAARNGSGAIRFSTGATDTEKVTIASGGNVGIGTTGPANPLTVVASVTGTNGYPLLIVNSANTTAAHGISLEAGTSSAGGAYFMYFSNPGGASPGSIVQNTASSIAFNTTSDRRLKENIVDSQQGLAVLEQLRVRDYNYIADGEKTPLQGFIAQELYEVYPQAVTVGGDDPKQQPWQVDYGKLTPLLVKSMQDLKAENDRLKTEIGAMKEIVCLDHPEAGLCRGN